MCRGVANSLSQVDVCIQVGRAQLSDIDLAD
jgi:hypothetical protein